MPKRVVKRRFGQGLSDVAKLADTFAVSRQAMLVRLQQLGLVDPTPRCDRAPLRKSNWYFRSLPLQRQDAHTPTREAVCVVP